MWTSWARKKVTLKRNPFLNHEIQSATLVYKQALFLNHLNTLISKWKRSLRGLYHLIARKSKFNVMGVCRMNLNCLGILAMLDTELTFKCYNLKVVVEIVSSWQYSYWNLIKASKIILNYHHDNGISNILLGVFLG